MNSWIIEISKRPRSPLELRKIEPYVKSECMACEQNLFCPFMLYHMPCPYF